MKQFIVAKCKVCGAEIKAELYPNRDREAIVGYGFQHNWELGVHNEHYVLVCPNGHKKVYFDMSWLDLPSDFEIIEVGDEDDA